MKIVEIIELKEMALREIERCRQELLETKNLTPMIVLLAPINEEKGSTYIAVQGDIMNSVSAKSWLAEKVRQLIRDHGYTATLFISDTYQLNLTEEEQVKRRLLNDLVIIAFPEVARILGVSHKLQEQILATMETIEGQSLVISQDYHRDPDDAVFSFGEINDTGRMARSTFKFFEQQAEA